MTRSRSALILAAAVVAAAPGAALAAPGNDDRDHAQPITHVPRAVGGTLDGAGQAKGEGGSSCARTAGTVWYRLDPQVTRRLVVHLRAGGDSDATVDVFERLRSRQNLLTCDVTDRNGQASVAFPAQRGHSYLVRVGRRVGSPADGFSLALEGAPGPPRLPGPQLPASGVSARLDRLQRTANAWSMRLTEGVRYRIALRHPGTACLPAAVYGPGASDRSEPVARLDCAGYALLTPRDAHGGRYSVVVRATGQHGTQRYHLEVGRAEADDSAPGVRLANYALQRGQLDGRGLDRLDLYRFDVTRRSVLFLHLRAPARSAFDVVLLTADGRRLRCACRADGTRTLHKGLHRGRYFVAVRARRPQAGRYTLLRASRTITESRLHLDAPLAAPGQPVTATVAVTPAVDGPVHLVLEQFDPLSGWQFVRTLHGRAVGGTATLRVLAPSVGRWRVRARYDGTRGRAPSLTGFAPFGMLATLNDG